MASVEEKLRVLRIEYEKCRALCQTFADLYDGGVYDGSDLDALGEAADAICEYIYPVPIGVHAREKIRVKAKFGG